MGTAEDGLAAQLERQLIDDRVEADDELAPLSLDGLGETVGEVRDRHRRGRVHVLRHRDSIYSEFRKARGAAEAAPRRSSEETGPGAASRP